MYMKFAPSFIPEFVTTVTFCKDSLRIRPGTQNKLRYIREFVFVLNDFTYI